ncbi:MAG: hypothetical protein C4518_07310 [Desulfobacteraceae bacterium]|nr:MAG: hypothetical protein C4518_07310 [Desulfobacteraceae bacterium]
MNFWMKDNMNQVKILAPHILLLDYLLKNGKNRVKGKVKDAELVDQYIQIDALPEEDRHMLKEILEAFIKKHRFEELAMK